MAGFVITAEYEVGDGPEPGPGLLAAGWGPGHEVSYFDGRRLTLVAQAWAAARAAAFEEVLTRAELLWAAVAGTPLPPPVRLRVDDVVLRERPGPGRLGRGPDRLFAESAARVAARLRATRAALVALEALDLPDAPHEALVVEASDAAAAPDRTRDRTRDQTRSTRSAIESATSDGRNG